MSAAPHPAPAAAHAAEHAAHAVEGGSLKESLFNFFVKPQGPAGLLLKSPLYIPYYGTKYPFKALKWSGGKAKDFITHSNYYPPLVKAGKIAANIPEAGARIVGGPLLEAAKFGLYRFPKHALFENAAITAKGMVNIPTAFVGKSAKAAWETIKSPFTVIGGVRQGIINLLYNAPKEVLNKNYGSALKMALNSPLEPIKAALKAPKAILDIPLHTAGEMAYTATAYGVNFGKTIGLIPETMWNGYKQMGRGVALLGKVKDEVGGKITTGLRQRFSDLFSMPTPLAPAMAAAH